MERVDESRTAVMAFTEDQVARLTGLSVRQLRYWRRHPAFFPPSFGGGFYSFRDLVGLRVVAQLRAKVPLQELRKVDQGLRERHDTPWASLTFYLAGREVVWKEPTGSLESRKGRVMAFPMEKVASETLKAVLADRSRKHDQLGRISQKRGVMGNRPVIAGTRIMTSAVWQFHDSGASAAEIIKQYPDLTLEDVRAAIEFEKKSRKAG